MKLRVLALATASTFPLALLAGNVFAQATPDSGNTLLQACKVFTNRSKWSSNSEAASTGQCLGVIGTVLSFRSQFGICVPAGGNTGQAMRIVVKYMDENPDKTHEPLAFLAVYALQAAWPCEKKSNP